MKSKAKRAKDKLLPFCGNSDESKHITVSSLDVLKKRKDVEKILLHGEIMEKCANNYSRKL